MGGMKLGALSKDRRGGCERARKLAKRVKAVVGSHPP